MDTTGNEKLIVNYEEKYEKNLAFSIDRYLEFVLQLNRLRDTERKTIQILLVEIDRHWNPDEFIKKITEKYKHIDGILFLTMEEFPRGDWPNSNLNQSRMVREMFENSYNAVTVNYFNFIPALWQLVSKIIKNNAKQCKLPDVLEKFGELQKKIVIELNQHQNFLQKLAQNGEIDRYKEGEPLTFLSRHYLLGGIHSSKLGHAGLRELYDSLDKEKAKVKRLWKKVNLLETLYDLALITASNPLRFHGLKILIIDDNPKKVEEDFKKQSKKQRIVDYFSPDTEIYITDAWEWKKFLYGNSFWENMHSKKAKLSLIKVGNNFGSQNKGKEKDLFEEIKAENKDKKYKKFIFNFIVVDLLMEDYNEGNQIINNLENFRNAFNRNAKKKEERTYFDIIVLSLSEEAHDISRALNEGALCYVPKKRIYMLPAVVAKLEKSRRIIENRADQFKSIQKSRNFGKLYRLPEIIRRKLETEPFLDLFFPVDIEGERKKEADNLNPYLKDTAKEWIKNIPKADLHCHLGGSIDADTAFFLSLNMLVRYCSKDQANHKDYKKILTNIAKQYFGFISHLVWRNFVDLKHLFRIVKILLDIIQKFDIEKPDIGILRKQNIIRYLLEKKESAPDEQWVVSYDILLKKQTKWFEVFLKKIQGYLKNSYIKKEAPGKIIAEKEFFQMLKYLNEENPKDIPLPDPVNIFNVLIAIIEGKKKDFKTFWQKLEEPISLPEFGGLKEFLLGENTPELISQKNENLFGEIKNALESNKSIETIKGENLLSYFISARQRRTRSLPEYLGGNEFMGSEQLQYKENILAALYSIIEKNIDDNVRYLEIRLSPDGYRDKGLTLQEAVQTLLSGTDLITFHFYRQGKFIRVNYIFSIKRHKSPREAALETSAAILNREREKCYREIMPKVNYKNLDIQKYEWKPSKVMGIDLSGLEKESPAQNFVSDFYPLFKTSSFITIHAGEEDTAQSIWAAIYLLHANRIGHGLTLQENPDLKDMFKNMQICIEMNPISNTQTNPNIKDSYPFYNFFIDGLNITINTDNPAVSESSLSDEFVKAGELFQKHRENIHRECNWISRWEILRVVKNGFSNAFLDREEKRQLIRAVEEEIYQKIIKEYEC